MAVRLPVMQIVTIFANKYCETDTQGKITHNCAKKQYNMRITLKTKPNTEPVPFEYQQKLVGTIHKWIGNNEFHDSISLYSFSWLQGAKRVKSALDFPSGASMFISFYNNEVVRAMVRSILEDPDMFCGLRVIDVMLEPTPDLSSRDLFYCASPVFIKRKLPDGSYKHFTYDDPEADKCLMETLRSKMRAAGLAEDETLDVHFDTSYSKKRVKLMHYRGVGNKANICPLFISAKKETKQFAWEVGLGNSTGIGFGTIY